MDAEKAKQLFKVTEVDYTLKGRVYMGLAFLAGYTSDEVISGAEHDIIYACAFESSVEQMSESDVRYLAVRGWFEEYDVWAHHV